MERCVHEQTDSKVVLLKDKDDNFYSEPKLGAIRQTYKLRQPNPDFVFFQMPRNTKKDARNWTGKITGIERQIKVESTWYILVGFTTHPNGNHYVSYVMYKNQWWYCNDEDAEQVKDDK